MLFFWKILKTLGYFLLFITLIIEAITIYNKFSNQELLLREYLFQNIAYFLGYFIGAIIILLPSIFIIKYASKKIVKNSAKADS
jgi:VIT1/CCC1 family predicted Fe2+/Mn2+ transporter